MSQWQQLLFNYSNNNIIIATWYPSHYYSFEKLIISYTSITMANAQYATLIKYRPALVDLLQHSLSTSHELLAEGLITREVNDLMLMPGESLSQKASRLIFCIADRVNHDDTAQSFYIFLDVLNKQDYFTVIVKSISTSILCRLLAIIL